MEGTDEQLHSATQRKRMRRMDTAAAHAQEAIIQMAHEAFLVESDALAWRAKYVAMEKQARYREALVWRLRKEKAQLLEIEKQLRKRLKQCE